MRQTVAPAEGSVSLQALLCAREDSNLHGRFRPQGPQPDTATVDGFRGVRSSPFCEVPGRVDSVGPRAPSSICRQRSIS
jgi:hypothetical protein